MKDTSKQKDKQPQPGSSPRNHNVETLLRELQERRKGLNCLYQVEEVLQQRELELPQLFQELIKVIPPGWQYPDSAQVKILYQDQVFSTPGYKETGLQQQAAITLEDHEIGELIVSYQESVPIGPGGAFLEEETQLLHAIADHIGHALLYRELKKVSRQWQEAEEKLTKKNIGQWRVILNMLQNSNMKLFLFLCRKMLHYLCWKGVTEAKQLLEQAGTCMVESKRNPIPLDDMNQPVPRESMQRLINIYNQVFSIASDNLTEDKIMELLQQWMAEDKSRFLVEALENPRSSLTELLNAISRFRYMETEGSGLSPAIEKSLRVSLIRHFLSEQLEFIKVAKNYIEIGDYYDLLRRIIFPAGSQGKLGGKSAGLFLAEHILKRACRKDQYKELFEGIKTPKTWYVTSDGLLSFLRYNNLDSVLEQKYKEMDAIHIEYPNIIQIFKNAHFQPGIIRGLSLALDDLGEVPIIVRSSSLLEDRLGAAFSGKYKSLFLANQGSKEKRLEALMDAIAEVYASTFSPDPIEYRSERGLLDFNEEMGIMIQEVVGTRVDKYFLPTFAGVAFSNNEFRWSARLNREDGLIRLVPGLGTRAVDRVSNGYPILVAPGKPDLRVNVALDEIVRYSPKNIDIINLESNTFETIDVKELIKAFGRDIPGIQDLVSILRDNMIQQPTSLFSLDFDKDTLLVTFDGYLKRTDLVKQLGALLKILAEKIGTPVDIEFAHDGKNLYLLQCRPQAYTENLQPAPIPQDMQEDKLMFSANRYVSNGYVPDITHIVYVEPISFNRLASRDDLKTIGRIVGRLNKILPKRQFILMGPGRWGSRGDIKLGVPVTYSDINNTAVLIEIARKKGNYIPDLSFGTHFFQDLVEASIHYLPLYPDDQGVIFNETFFTRSANILADLLPEYTSFAETVRVIDVPRETSGNVLRILMNAELDQAVGIIAEPGARRETSASHQRLPLGKVTEDYWRWRYRMAETIAARLDPQRFGVKAFYLFGSTKNATAGPASDIDIIIHFIGTERQRKDLMLWLEGWSLTLAELNHQHTGYRSPDGLLDIHLVSDEDIAKKTSYASKIGAVTDAARSIPMNQPDK